MGRLNRYILKNALISIGGLVIFACCVLLLERLLRIFQLVSNSTTPGADASRMIVNLLPYYLGMALPLALLLGTILTIDRLSKSSELTAALGAGVSLFHMTKPFILIAVILSGVTVFVDGYLQPVGRYKYRQTAHFVKQQSYTAALREGTFTGIDDQTFFAGTDGENGAIGPIFIYNVEASSDERIGYRIATAGVGKINILEGRPVLNLAKGRAFQIINGELSGESSFAGSAVTVSPTREDYRIRGDDEREMTSSELFANRSGEVTEKIDINTNNSTLHLRLSKAALILLLPFLGVPLGLNYGRNPSAAGIFVGVVFLVSVNKALELGQTLGAAGKIPPWLGTWGIIAVISVAALILFWKSAYKMGQPPLTSFSHWMGHIKDETLSNIKRITRDRRQKRHV